MNHLFVYGTLMRGQARADLVVATSVRPAWTTGRLYHHPHGYPVLVDVPEGRVHGQLLEVADLADRVAALDEYEGEPYQRLVRTIFLADGESLPSWCYVVDIAHEAALLALGAELVSGGRWTPRHGA